MANDEFDDQLSLANAKVSALMKQAAGLREFGKDDPDLAHLSVAKIALQLAAIEIVSFETDEPDLDKLRELVSKHARALRDT